MRQTKTDRKNIWYLYTLHVEKGRGTRSTRRLRAKGIGCSVYWKTPVNRMELYAGPGVRRAGPARTSMTRSTTCSLCPSTRQ